MMNRFVSFLGTLALLVALAVPAEAQKSTLQTVKERGTLVAGVKNDVPAFGFIDEKGAHVGFDVDVVAGVARVLGVKLEIVPVTSATRIPILQQGRVDVIAATLTHYRKRDEVIDFTIPYFTTPQTTLVKRDSGIKTLADLSGKHAGFNLGSAALKAFQTAQPKATTQTFQGLPEAFLALQRGLVDAIPTDIVLLASLRATAPNPADYTILGPAGNFGGGDYALGLRENDSDWRDALNFALQDLWKDGSWDKIFDKWLGKNSKLQLKKEDIGFKMVVWDD